MHEDVGYVDGDEIYIPGAMTTGERDAGRVAGSYPYSAYGGVLPALGHVLGGYTSVFDEWQGGLPIAISIPVQSVARSGL